ncbi:AAA domain-containing protein [Deinococcus yunweiensis]|uniref:bifunctional RecB family nuclease/DEAD/DEAH box helicase n=1 Tax=Deinococcus yunweiensis TaxID=367282 RepID=UPI00398E5062
MPKLTKKALSLYLRNGCERQMRFSLYSDRELQSRGMPPRQTARAGLGFAAQAGDEYQHEKVEELRRAFGTHVRDGGLEGRSPFKYAALDLATALPHTGPGDILIEGNFKLGEAFRRTYRLDTLLDHEGGRVETGEVRPDLIQVLPSHAPGLPPFPTVLTADGSVILADPLDKRLRLRVLDIKLSSQPGAAYFGEVVFYSLALAAWLQEIGLDDRFVVLPNPGIWPGSYEDSALHRCLIADMTSGIPTSVMERLAALEADLETVDLETFAPSVRSFLERDLPRIAGSAWPALAWHANFRCLGCEFYGHTWTTRDHQPTHHDLHCAPTAQRTGHLSRVPGLSRGLAASLRAAGVPSVEALARLSPTSPVFDTSHALRGKRTLLPARAQALHNGAATLVPLTGASAVLPRSVDVQIFLDLEYDPSTAITGALALWASWQMAAPFAANVPPADRPRKSWGQRVAERLVWVVDRKDLVLERNQFLAFLQQLKDILDEVAVSDDARLAAQAHGMKEQRSTYQIYLWDRAQLTHLSRLVSRHLEAILATPGLDELAWLFPSPELLQRAEDVSRASPISLVAPAVDAYLALPLAHHTTLLDVAQHYRNSTLTPDYYVVGQHFHDPLSNLVPPERIHEMWQASKDPERHAQGYGWVRERLEIVAHRKAAALQDVTRHLVEDLARRQLLASGAAPTVGLSHERLDGVADASQLLYQYHRLNAATQRLESDLSYALPVHERVAKFKTARLGSLVQGSVRRIMLAKINAACQTSLDVRDPRLLVYELPQDSRGVNMREGEIGVQFSPLGDPLFLHRKVSSLPQIDRAVRAGWVGNGQRFRPVADSGLFEVTIVAIDRTNGYLVLLPASRHFEALAAQVGVDYRTGGTLDRISKDFLASKLKATLRSIGAALSMAPDEAAVAVIAGNARGARVGEPTPETPPAAEYLWHAARTHAITRVGAAQQIQEQLEQLGVHINDSQWTAMHSVLTRRLSVIWGPPGTGKSQTVRAIIRAALLEAQASGQPLRILVASGTYTAVDNILLRVVDELAETGQDIHTYRVQSGQRPVEEAVTAVQARHPARFKNIELDRREAPPHQDTAALLATLESPLHPVLVGAPAQQLHNLAYAGDRATSDPRFATRDWFDLVIIDEASQMDVATSTLVLTKAARGGRAMLAGDDLQLPPIHPADKPEGFEYQLGSLYEFMTRVHGIKPVCLDVNYRSNEEIVAATRLSNYTNLTSHSKAMRLNLLDWPPDAAPESWPPHLAWCEGWAALLNPARPVVCFVYEDATSGQANDFEAEAIAAVAWLARAHLASEPRSRLNPDKTEQPAPAVPCDDRYFWSRGLGVVTPHKAQVGRVSDGLLRTFPDVTAQAIRSAVDTVERFQGQERQIIVASFGVGDPDVISSEDSFLYDVRRFNVMVSRPETKLIVFLTRTFVDYLSNDKETLDQSSLIKRFANVLCQPGGALTLHWRDEQGQARAVTGDLRFPGD